MFLTTNHRNLVPRISFLPVPGSEREREVTASTWEATWNKVALHLLNTCILPLADKTGG